jgi:hypothetical protein
MVGAISGLIAPAINPSSTGPNGASRIGRATPYLDHPSSDSTESVERFSERPRYHPSGPRPKPASGLCNAIERYAENGPRLDEPTSSRTSNSLRAPLIRERAAFFVSLKRSISLDTGLTELSFTAQRRAYPFTSVALPGSSLIAAARPRGILYPLLGFRIAYTSGPAYEPLLT